MAKVITTIAAEDGMSVEQILSFKTENYIGIWNYNDDDYILFAKTDYEFRPVFLKYDLEDCPSLKELDDMVWEECEEHILEVFDRADYTFTLEVD